MEGNMAHGVERVADSDNDAVRRVRYGASGTVPHDLGIRSQKIIPAHPGFPRNARGNDDDIRAGRVLIVVGPDNVAVIAFDGTRLEHVQRLSLRDTLEDVDHYHVRQLAIYQPLGQGRSHISGSYNRHFLSHGRSLSRIADFGLRIADLFQSEIGNLQYPGRFLWNGPYPQNCGLLQSAIRNPQSLYACMFSMIAEANSEVFSFVAPCIWRSKS